MKNLFLHHPENPLRFVTIVLLILLLSSLFASWINERYPLSEAHWDVPIYLLRAKEFSQGNHLQFFRNHGVEIGSALEHGEYDTGFWPFARFGTTVLNGSIVGMVGNDERSIYLMTWVYRLLFAGGLFFSVLAAYEINRKFLPNITDSSLIFGVLISLMLYLFSDISGYMSNNIVSEVPAIFVLGLGTWTLISAWTKRSLPYAAASGFLAFTLYVVRMESIWSSIAFFVAIVWLFSDKFLARGIWWSGILTAMFSAAFPFLIYSWEFFPLTDPRLFLKFGELQAERHGRLTGSTGEQLIAFTRQLAVAVGLLWIGFLLALPLIRTNRVLHFGIIWVTLLLLPVGFAFSEGYTTQVRMYTTFMPAFLLLSTLGWAHVPSPVLQARSNIKLIVAVLLSVFLVLLSHPASYSTIRTLPGMWRLQFVRDYLAPPKYERVDYHLPELFDIRRFLDNLDHQFILVVSPDMQGADHFMIINYLDQTSTGMIIDSNNSEVTEYPVSSTLSRVYLAQGTTEDESF